MGPSLATKLKQKRGEGRGKDYIPWFKVNEVSSIGNSSRPYGFKTRREHHFLSNFKQDYFTFLIWMKV